VNIVLVGMMGAGKTTVGRILARDLGWPLVDTDKVVEERAGRSIPELFALEGEKGFRAREAEAIAWVAAQDGQVIATGGGAVLSPANREALRSSGVVFWLDAPPEELYRRAAAQGVQCRPLLAGAENGDPLAALAKLAASRAQAYREAAHCRIETAGRSAEAVAKEIRARLLRGEYDSA